MYHTLWSIPCLDIYKREMKTKICGEMFLTTLLITTKKWKQPTYYQQENRQTKDYIYDTFKELIEACKELL